MQPLNLRVSEVPAVLAVVRLGTVTLEDAAAADDRSVSSWIRRAVEHELER